MKYNMKNDQIGFGDPATRIHPMLIQSLSGIPIREISCGLAYTMFLSESGNIYMVGYNSDGQLCLGDFLSRSIPTLVTGIANITTIASGGSHSLMVASDGSVYSCGLNNVLVFNLICRTDNLELETKRLLGFDGQLVF